MKSRHYLAFCRMRWQILHYDELFSHMGVVSSIMPNSAPSSSPPWSTEKEKYQSVKLEPKAILANRNNLILSNLLPFGPSIIINEDLYVSSSPVAPWNKASVSVMATAANGNHQVNTLWKLAVLLTLGKTSRVFKYFRKEVLQIKDEWVIIYLW